MPVGSTSWICCPQMVLLSWHWGDGKGSCLKLGVLLLWLTLGSPPEVGFSCPLWIFSVLLRHCVGKYSSRTLLECGWAVKASRKNCSHGITGLCPLSQALPRVPALLWAGSEVIASSAQWGCSRTLPSKAPLCFPLRSGAWPFRLDCPYQLWILATAKQSPESQWRTT